MYINAKSWFVIFHIVKSGHRRQGTFQIAALHPVPGVANKINNLSLFGTQKT